jgi:hypothetical protein
MLMSLMPVLGEARRYLPKATHLPRHKLTGSNNTSVDRVRWIIGQLNSLETASLFQPRCYGILRASRHAVGRL